jgi:signal transduction histidine kinase
MPLPIERKLPIIFSFVFLILAGIGFLLYRNTVSVQEAREFERRSQSVISNLDDIVTYTADLETATSGFIALGSDAYLEPLSNGKAGLKQNISELRAVLAASPSRIGEIDQLDTLINNKLDFEQNKIELRRREGFEQTAPLLGKTAGIVITGQIRALVDQLKSEEIAIQAAHERNLDINFNLSILSLVLSTIAGVAALVAAYFLVVTEIRKRRGAEISLVEANKGLEKRIEERTLELKEANKNLIESALEREHLLVNEKAARKEAEVANRLRDEFMATVSHELRTPLNSILGWARLLQTGSLDTEKSEKAVKTIVKNSETQNRLIEDLLDAARIISGKLELAHEPVDVVEVVMHSIETVRPSADLKSILIGLDVETGGHEPVITGDKDRLQQVVSNLLTNAIKFTPNGGRIAVSLAAEDGKVILSVSDNGVGISPDFLPNVFERFRQDPATIRRSGGLGLGLAVVRNLVEMHGGTVEAASDGENKGSTFTLLLPRSGPPQSQIQ